MPAVGGADKPLSAERVCKITRSPDSQKFISNCRHTFLRAKVTHQVGRELGIGGLVEPGSSPEADTSAKRSRLDPGTSVNPRGTDTATPILPRAAKFKWDDGCEVSCRGLACGGALATSKSQHPSGFRASYPSCESCQPHRVVSAFCPSVTGGKAGQGGRLTCLTPPSWEVAVGAGPGLGHLHPSTDRTRVNSRRAPVPGWCRRRPPWEERPASSGSSGRAPQPAGRTARGVGCRWERPSSPVIWNSFTSEG